jgi:hypothetical protein
MNIIKEKKRPLTPVQTVSKKYVPLTLKMLHQLYLEHQKRKAPLIINYIWSDGADPNKYPNEAHKYQFIPDGSIHIQKGNKQQIISDYLSHDKIKYPYHSIDNKQSKPDIFFYLGGKHNFNEGDGFFKSKMQICSDSLNSLSDTCISGYNWIINPKNNKTHIKHNKTQLTKYPIKKMTKKMTARTPHKLSI